MKTLLTLALLTGSLTLSVPAHAQCRPCSPAQLAQARKAHVGRWLRETNADMIRLGLTATRIIRFPDDSLLVEYTNASRTSSGTRQLLWGNVCQRKTGGHLVSYAQLLQMYPVAVAPQNVAPAKGNGVIMASGSVAKPPVAVVGGVGTPHPRVVVRPAAAMSVKVAPVAPPTPVRPVLVRPQTQPQPVPRMAPAPRPAAPARTARSN